jgi:hypothetical protein
MSGSTTPKARIKNTRIHDSAHNGDIGLPCNLCVTAHYFERIPEFPPYTKLGCFMIKKNKAE